MNSARRDIHAAGSALRLLDVLSRLLSPGKVCQIEVSPRPEGSYQSAHW